MRNLMDQLSARHFVVLSLALLLVLGGVSAAFADRGDEQARGEESPEAEAVAADDTDDDPNDETRLSRLTESPTASPDDTAVTDHDGPDSDGVATTGDAAAAAAQTDNDGTDSEGVDTTG